MATRKDIPGRLIYTCNCGWVDKGHADAKSTRPHVGVQSLWQQIRSKSGIRTRWPFEGYLVVYKQDMWKAGISVSYEGKYLVAQELSPLQMESVALGIFLEVSFGFESMQWWTGATSSSFSEEDFVSNLLGFYAVLRPELDIMKLCGPVSADASFAVWDVGKGLGKNKTTEPVFHACEECKDLPAFPQQLRQIVPAPKGKRGGNLWRDWQGKGLW
jgi:hypothetical protein